MRAYALIVSAALFGCGGSDQPAAKTPASVSTASATGATGTGGAGGEIRSLALAPDSMKIDKIGGSDGALKPDGNMDFALTADVEGPIAAFFIISTNAQGEPTGDYQADTITGLDQLPKDFPIAVRAGMLTAGLGVWEGDRMLNKPDGSIEPVGAGPHKVTFYLASTGVLQSGKSHVRVYGMRADKSVVKGPVTAL